MSATWTLLRHGVLVVLACGFALVACAIDETHHESVVLAARPLRETVTCSTPFVKPDLAGLEPCGDAARGHGHCYPASKVPIPKAELDACGDAGDLCVPDKVLKSAGAKVQACTFFLDGKPGACVSLLSKRVFANKDVLKQDACATDERCLPCVDPRDGKTTGLCDDAGVHEGACIGGPGERAISCCHKMGECIALEAVPEDARSSTIVDTCKDGKVCAPTSQLDAKPVKCEYLGATGVCLDVCFAGALAGLRSLGRGACGPTELCLPCALANASGSEQRLIGCE